MSASATLDAGVEDITALAMRGDKWIVRDAPDTLLDIWVIRRTVQRNSAMVPTLWMYSNGLQRVVEVFLPPDGEEDSYAHTLDDVLALSFASEARFQDGTHLAFLWLHMYERSAMRALYDNTSGCAKVDVHPWRLALSRKGGIDVDTKASLACNLV